MNTDDELRQALQDAADEFQPSPDAWRQNQIRVRRRRRNIQVASTLGAVAVVGAGFGGLALAREGGHHPTSSPALRQTATAKPTQSSTVRPVGAVPVPWTRAMHLVGPVHQFHHYTSNGTRYNAYVALAQNGKNRNDLLLCETEQPSGKPRPTVFPDYSCTPRVAPAARHHVGRLFDKEPTILPAAPLAEFNYGVVSNDVQQLTLYMNKTRSGGPPVPHRAQLLRGGPLTISIVVATPPVEALSDHATGRTTSGQSFSEVPPGS